MHTLLTFLVGVCHHFGVSVQENLRRVEEIDLENLITQSEHDSMLSLKPLLHEDQFSLVYGDDGAIFDLGIEVVFEVF